jgi:hypothetical protein
MLERISFEQLSFFDTGNICTVGPETLLVPAKVGVHHSGELATLPELSDAVFKYRMQFGILF